MLLQLFHLKRQAKKTKKAFVLMMVWAKELLKRKKKTRKTLQNFESLAVHWMMMMMMMMQMPKERLQAKKKKKLKLKLHVEL